MRPSHSSPRGDSQRTQAAPRIAREQRTIRAMVQIFCRGRHGGPGPICACCQEVLDYALCRLDRCPFGTEKGTCAACPIHCYKPAMRARVKEVMRYAGPRMIWRYPILTLRHWMDRRGRDATVGELMARAPGSG